MQTMIIFFCACSMAFAQAANPWHAAVPLTWGPQTDRWQFAIFSQRQGYLSNEPINVMLVAHNGTSTQFKIFVDKSPWEVADFRIKRVSDGKTVSTRPPRDAFDRLRRSGLGAYETQVKPGGLVRFSVVNLRVMFDLDPGEYDVQAFKKLPSETTHASISVPSNEIRITVVSR